MELERSQKVIDSDLVEEHKGARSYLELHQLEEEDGPGSARRVVNLVKGLRALYFLKKS